jgi:hypothetical protein
MKTESDICKEYGNKLEEFGKLDCAYYVKKAPTRAERAEYFQRQTVLGELRDAFYSELAAIGHSYCGTPEYFRLEIDDPIMDTPVLSAPQCLLTHNLTNSLSIITAYSELLAELVLGKPMEQKYVQSIRDAASKMAACIHERACV